MDVGFEFTPLVASKLIVFTFGSLVHLFLMVLILGQRRLRRLEWLLFALMAALFMWNVGNLLALNVGLFYGVGPRTLSQISRLIPFVGLVLSAPLLVHLHVEYAHASGSKPWRERLLVVAFYLPLAGAPWLVARLLGQMEFDPPAVLRPFDKPLALWMIAALAVAAAYNFYFARRSEGPPFKRFHAGVGGLQAFLAAGLALAFLARALPPSGLGGYSSAFLMLVAVAPSAFLGYSILRYNFLDLRVQRNLVYSMVTIFALLLYLDVIRRVSTFLEAHDILPAVAAESIMIFILVVLLEPVKKLINRALHTAFVSEYESVQKLSAEIQDYSKQTGDVEALKRFVAEKVPPVLGIESVKLELGRAAWKVTSPGEAPSKTRSFLIRRVGEVVGRLEVTPLTSELSGDKYGALEFLADQLAAAVELCQLIATKVELERALAEKAKMAFLGEMAARIAHNVKNPLSSMKTLVQLLEEDSNLPERVRQDCRLVAGEIDRLNSNISQVLRYAKPARDTDRPTDLVAVARRVLSLLSAEAERRGVRLEFEAAVESCPVAGGEEAASDIVSNLVVNALESCSQGRAVRIGISAGPPDAESALFSVEDEGPGVPSHLKEKIFQPFFTTRPGGTGLGLAIVSRRAEEAGGSVVCVSPLTNEGGARFLVRFRCAQPTVTQGRVTVSSS